MITVYYFAGLRDITGKGEEVLPVTQTTVSDLLMQVTSMYDRFPSGPGAIHVAVNEEYAHPGDSVTAGDVVAFIPPVSGG